MKNWMGVSVLLLGMVACSGCASYVASQYGITPTPLKMSADPDMEFVKTVRAPTSDPYFDLVKIYVKNNGDRAKSCDLQKRAYTQQAGTTSRLSSEEFLDFGIIGPGETKTVEFRICSNYTTSKSSSWKGCEYEIGELSCYLI